MQSACLEKGSNVNFSFIVGTFSLYLVVILLDPITKKKKKTRLSPHRGIYESQIAFTYSGWFSYLNKTISFFFLHFTINIFPLKKKFI